jgi:hypothetical protein
MLPADIQLDDPELLEILATLPKDAYSINDIIANGPKKRTDLYHDINSGKLRTFLCGRFRLALKIDYAKYLLLLRREGAASDRDTELRQRGRDLRRAALDRRSQGGEASPEAA